MQKRFKEHTMNFMEKNTPLFSIIYVNYNSVTYLERSLQSLFEKEKKSLFEVIIINNDIRESEALRHLAKKFPLKIRENKINKGFGAAVNQGVLLAESLWIGLLNPDTLWPKEQLERLTKETEGRDLLFGLSLCDENGVRETHGSGVQVTLGTLFKNHLKKGTKEELGKKEKKVDWISGGALFFQKTLWQELGGFDEGYFLYYEDVDFCERARQRRKELVIFEQFHVIHYGGKSHESKEKQKKEYRTSQAYYFTKFRPRYEQKILRMIHFFM